MGVKTPVTQDGVGQGVAQESAFGGFVTSAMNFQSMEVKFCDAILLEGGAYVSVRTESQDSCVRTDSENVHTSFLNCLAHLRCASNVANHTAESTWCINHG